MNELLNIKLDELIISIKAHEGYSGIPYIDTIGKITIGYGRNLTDVGISRAEAEVLFKSDVNLAVDQFFTKIPLFVREQCNLVRKHVLIEMIFNMGIKKVLKFRNMLAAIEAGDFEKASKEMLNSKWAEQVGGRAISMARKMRNGS